MANPEHLQWLVEGVLEWNSRRSAHPFRPDFWRADIRGAFIAAGAMGAFGRFNLAGADLAGADLERANLEGVNLNHANLAGADLDRANLRRASMQDASLTRASLRGAFLGEADLDRAVLKGGDLSLADLCKSRLRWADLRAANLKLAYLWDTDLQGADLAGANIQSTPSGWREGKTGAVVPTDLSRVLNLTQEQLNDMRGDAGVTLPERLRPPPDWPDWREAIGFLTRRA